MAVYEAEINNIVARLYDFTDAEQKIIAENHHCLSHRQLKQGVDRDITPSPTIIGTNDLPSSPINRINRAKYLKSQIEV